MSQLLDLVKESNQLTQTLVETGGELTVELENALAINAQELAQKTDSYSYLLDRLKFEAEYFKARAEVLNKISKAHMTICDRLKDRIKLAMRFMGVSDLVGDESRFKLSTSRPKLILEDDLDPAYFMTVTEVVPDKTKIENALAEGKTVRGARYEESFALRSYVNRKLK